MIHRKMGGFDELFDVVQALPHLIRKFARACSVSAVRSLT